MMTSRSLTLSPVIFHAVVSPVIRKADLMDRRPSTHSGRMRFVTSTRASMICARGVVMVAQSPCCEADFGGQLGRDFAEHLRL